VEKHHLTVYDAENNKIIHQSILCIFIFYYFNMLVASPVEETLMKNEPHDIEIMAAILRCSCCSRSIRKDQRKQH
jgi:hypothetical protein